jgi:multisubunit Na+/H+ antiporter MnhB subunit
VIPASLTLDLLLALGLPAVALVAILRRDPLEAVMLLFGFGVLLALTWARLGAPDVAMVEAALGAGVTGALFLSALGRMGIGGASERRHALAWLGLLALAAVALLPTALAVGSLPARSDGLSPAVHAAVPATGATHPVTSVLLDFRGYDTLLEIGVLLLAVLGTWSVRGASPPHPEPDAGPILRSTVALLLPPIVVVAGVLLWIGASAPGGAFQAGTVLGTTLILALLSGTVRLRRLPDVALRALTASGFAVFLAVAAGAALASGALLDYPPARAAELMLGIEAALTLSIAVVMAWIFEGNVPTGTPGGGP